MGYHDQSHEDYQTGCALLIRREAIEKIGLLDESYLAYFEDVDFCLRAKKSGFKVVCVQKTKIWHKVSRTTGGGLTPKKAYLKAKNGVKFFRKYSPKFYYYFTMPVSVFFYLTIVSLAERLKNNRGVFHSFIKGLVDGVKS